MTRWCSLVLVATLVACLVFPAWGSESTPLAPAPSPAPSASLVGYGISRGLVHGLMATSALAGNDPSNGALVAGGALGAAVEGTTAWLTLRRTPVTAGAAHTLANASDYGLLSAPALIVENTPTDQDETYSLLIGAGAMAGWILSYVTGRGDTSSENRHSMSMSMNPLALAMLPLLDARAERAGGVAQGSMATELARVRIRS